VTAADISKTQVEPGEKYALERGVSVMSINNETQNDIEAYYEARSDFALYPYAEDWGRVIDRFG